MRILFNMYTAPIYNTFLCSIDILYIVSFFIAAGTFKNYMVHIYKIESHSKSVHINTLL